MFKWNLVACKAGRAKNRNCHRVFALMAVVCRCGCGALLWWLLLLLLLLLFVFAVAFGAAVGVGVALGVVVTVGAVGAVRAVAGVVLDFFNTAVADVFAAARVPVIGPVAVKVVAAAAAVAVVDGGCSPGRVTCTGASAGFDSVFGFVVVSLASA